MTNQQVVKSFFKKIPKNDLERRQGLLSGNSTLWETKKDFRRMISDPVTLNFATKTGDRASGTMGSRGLLDSKGNDTTGNMYIAIKGVRGAISMSSTDTIQDVADAINANESFIKKANGEKYDPPLLIASVDDSQLTIAGSGGELFTLSGDKNVLEAAGLGTTFSMLSQIGIWKKRKTRV